MSRFCICLIASCLLVLVVSNAAAQTDLRFRGAGVEVGLVNPEDIDATFGFGALVDLGTIVPRLQLEAHLDYWSKSQDEYGVEFSVRDIAVGAKAKYLFDVPTTKIQPFAGGGLGLHFVNAEMTIPEQNIMGIIVPGSSASDGSTKLGLDLGGGFYAPMTPNMNFVTEMWAGIVSDVNQFALKVGVLYNL